MSKVRTRGGETPRVRLRRRKHDAVRSVGVKEMSAAGLQTARTLGGRAPLGVSPAAAGRFGAINAPGAREKGSLFRYTIATSMKADALKVAALARAVDRLDPSARGLIDSVEVGVSDGCVHLSMTSNEARRRVSRIARRLFAQIWYDALGDQPDESWSVECAAFVEPRPDQAS